MGTMISVRENPWRTLARLERLHHAVRNSGSAGMPSCFAKHLMGGAAHRVVARAEISRLESAVELRRTLRSGYRSSPMASRPGSFACSVVATHEFPTDQYS